MIDREHCDVEREGKVSGKQEERGSWSSVLTNWKKHRSIPPDLTANENAELLDRTNHIGQQASRRTLMDSNIYLYPFHRFPPDNEADECYEDDNDDGGDKALLIHPVII